MCDKIIGIRCDPGSPGHRGCSKIDQFQCHDKQLNIIVKNRTERCEMSEEIRGIKCDPGPPGHRGYSNEIFPYYDKGWNIIVKNREQWNKINDLTAELGFIRYANANNPNIPQEVRDQYEDANKRKS